MMEQFKGSDYQIVIDLDGLEYKVQRSNKNLGFEGDLRWTREFQRSVR
jgi:hypothetical protein